MGLSIYPFKSWKDLKGCSQVAEVIERVHSSEVAGGGGRKNTRTVETEFEGMLWQDGSNKKCRGADLPWFLAGFPVNLKVTLQSVTSPWGWGTVQVGKVIPVAQCFRKSMANHKTIRRIYCWWPSSAASE